MEYSSLKFDIPTSLLLLSEVINEKTGFLFSLILYISGLCFSQSISVDYNDYYKFPLSLGIEYQTLSPFADYASTYNIFDLSANIRWPIPSKPVLQPALRFGMMSFDNQDLVDPLKWDSTHWYGMMIEKWQPLLPLQIAPCETTQVLSAKAVEKVLSPLTRNPCSLLFRSFMLWER